MMKEEGDEENHHSHVSLYKKTTMTADDSFMGRTISPDSC